MMARGIRGGTHTTSSAGGRRPALTGWGGRPTVVTTGSGIAEIPGASPVKAKKLKRGGIVTIATVLGLVAAMGLTILGLGAADHAVASNDASSWLWSALRSEMGRV